MKLNVKEETRMDLHADLGLHVKNSLLLLHFKMITCIMLLVLLFSEYYLSLNLILLLF